MNKIQQFQNLLPAGIDAAVITSEHNRNYFLGFASSNGTLLVARDKAFFFTDSRYITAAKEAVTSAEVVLEKGVPLANLKAFLAGKPYRTLALEAKHITLARFAAFQEELAGCTLDISGELDRLILHTLRRKKSPEEARKIRAAQAVTDACFAHILSFIREGMTEKEIALEMDYYMLSHGADALSFETIVASGENGAKPHAVPGNRRVRQGDFITMDFGAVVDFYHSDMTRTVALGEPTGEMLQVYNTVLFAQNAAIAAAKEGVKCVEIDAVARHIIESAGYGDYFGHGLGHGVGVEIHEEPCFNTRSEDVFSAGDVVTVEPGIYLPGRFGVRIEDMIYHDGQKVVNLTESEKKLIVL
ncbi:MAG: M24 family metallopeptidase [Ruminococcaceae bacterium]|nr:M24 family metallopeptidase [Oscillospiraceae bacterium]